MIKTTKIIYIYTAILSCLGFSSCKKDDSNVIQINSVWNHEVDTESTEIHSTYFNKWIRLHGEGFSGLQKIYLNGNEVNFNPIFVTNHDIIVRVPSIPVGSEVTIPEQLNTIRIIAQGVETVYSDFIFKDPDKIPSVSGVTSTMPYPGESVEITGANLANTTKVYFPGDIEAEIVSATNTSVNVKVPSNVDRSISGSIRIVADGDEFSSSPFMFYQNGIFLKSFIEEATKGTSGANTNSTIINTPADIAKATGIPVNNPTTVLAIPNMPRNIPVVSSNTWAGLFRFRPFVALQEVIDNPLNEISASSSLQNLALQFELYMAEPWKSGYISLAINKNAGSATNPYRYNYYGWTTDMPMNFGGKWRTVTIPFSYFRNLALGPLGDYVNTIKGNNYEAIISFSNANPDNDGHTPQPISNFQMFIANVRLVPLK